MSGAVACPEIASLICTPRLPHPTPYPHERRSKGATSHPLNDCLMPTRHAITIPPHRWLPTRNRRRRCEGARACRLICKRLSTISIGHKPRGLGSGALQYGSRVRTYTCVDIAPWILGREEAADVRILLFVPQWVTTKLFRFFFFFRQGDIL